MKSQYELALCIAIKAHDGQFRRDGVTPYVTHPICVANNVSAAAKPVALLHDVLEDTPTTLYDLSAAGIEGETLDAVALLTKWPNDCVYEIYIKALMQNPIAREVKIADIEHNLASEPNPKNIPKYTKALAALKAGKVGGVKI